MSFEGENESKNLFDKFGLEVASGDVEVGKTYPIYGMITEINNDKPGAVVVTLNFTIRANMTIPDSKKVEILKERAFEPGIFVSKILSKGETGIVVDCSTVVFGRRQNYSA